MKRKLVLYLLLSFVLLFIFSCAKSPMETEKLDNQADELNPYDTNNNSSTRAGSAVFEDLANGPCLGDNEMLVADLIAGQHILIGVVTVVQNGDFLDVSYIIEEPDWFIEETHLHIATNYYDIPQTKKGSPKIGHFDYKEDHDWISSYTYSIPFDPEWCGVELFFAAHAAVSNGETAWAGDLPLLGKRWGFYFTGSFDCGCEQYLLTTKTTNAGDAEIYLISTIDGLPQLIDTLPIGASGGSGFNANAYDPDENVFYFSYLNGNEDKNLYYYDLDDYSWGLLGQLDFSASNGTFYNNSYYYFTNGFSPKLEEVVITYANNGVPSMEIETTIFTSSNPTICTDISIKNGKMYGIVLSFPTFAYKYFSLDLSDPNNTYELSSISGIGNIEIAFGSDGILYGINSSNGNLYYLNDPDTYSPILIP